jgi:hypothetical protein
MVRTSWYAFQRHGPKRLALRRTWRLGGDPWADIAVRVDAVEIARLNGKQLREGVELELFDHSVLRLCLEYPPARASGPPALTITRNGHPLPRSAGDPAFVVRSTLIFILVFASIQVVVGALFVLGGVTRDPPMVASFVLGLVLMALVALAWHHSVVAITAAGIVFMGEWLLFIGKFTNRWTIWQPLFVSLGLGWLILRGIKAARQLKAMRLPIRHPPDAA